jgi:putative transposase
VDRRIAPSVQIEAAIEAVLLNGLEEPDRLSELGRLGARLVLQRAVEDELEAFLGRARYERTETAAGSRNGHRPRRIQTAEGEITIAMPQVRDSLTRFVSATIPDTRAIVRTRPLEALVIGAYVRGLSDRDIESLAREAGLGSISRSSVSTIAASSGIGTWRSGQEVSPMSASSASCSTRSTCRSGPMAPGRASSSPGASPSTASGSCSMSASVSVSESRTGSISARASSGAASGARSSSSATEPRA